MSHYSGHSQNVQVPRARVAFFGISIVAVGLFGFYNHLSNKHECKHAHDRGSETEARVSSWEHRMLQRGTPVSSATSPAALRASRVEARQNPLSAPATTHNARHRTVSDDRASSNGEPESYAQPTAQKGHSDGRPGVYTRNPGWREGIHHATGGKSPTMGSGDGVGEGEVQKVQEVMDDVKDSVKSVFGK